MIIRDHGCHSRLRKTSWPAGAPAVFLAVAAMLICGGAAADDAETVRASANHPLNAAYKVEGRIIQLIDGRGETQTAPGSAAKMIAAVFGQPAYGNIDGNAGEDAALILSINRGGSGTFYYIAAAINRNGIYLGTPAVFLGDRVAPQNIDIRNGLIIANYADRGPDEPMTAPPSIGISKYLLLEGDRLTEISPLQPGEAVLGGWVTIGHEVRSFKPCSGETVLWLMGDSPALKEIMAAYRNALPIPLPYTPLFMILSGKNVEVPSDGFGADYEGAFFVTRLISVFPEGNCESDAIGASHRRQLRD